MRNELTSRSVHSMCTVTTFQKSVVMVRAKSVRIELSNSRYSRHVIALGNGLLNFNSILILPFSGWDVCPSDTPLSSVRSKSDMK